MNDGLKQDGSLMTHDRMEVADQILLFIITLKISFMAFYTTELLNPRF